MLHRDKGRQTLDVVALLLVSSRVIDVSFMRELSFGLTFTSEVEWDGSDVGTLLEIFLFSSLLLHKRQWQCLTSSFLII